MKQLQLLALKDFFSFCDRVTSAIETMEWNIAKEPPQKNI